AILCNLTSAAKSWTAAHDRSKEENVHPNERDRGTYDFIPVDNEALPRPAGPQEDFAGIEFRLNCGIGVVPSSCGALMLRRRQLDFLGRSKTRPFPQFSFD